jgi:hypothetical protein
MQIVNAFDWLIVKAHDDVAFPQSTLTRRAVRFERDHQDPALDFEIVISHDATRQRHVLTGQTDVTSADSPVAHQPAGDKLRCID